MALFAHEAHAFVAHEGEACEICIHLQSNDDFIETESYQEVTFIGFKNSEFIEHIADFLPQIHLVKDPIRGPPQI